MSGKKQKAEALKNQATKKLLKRLKWPLALAVVAGFAGILYATQEPTPKFMTASVETVTAGEGLYQKSCAVCHGINGIGENASAVKGGSRPGGGFFAPAVNGKAHTWHHSPDLLFSIIKNGSPAKGSPMRGWKDRMSDNEIQSVLAYIYNLWPDRIQARYRTAFPNG